MVKKKNQTIMSFSSSNSHSKWWLLLEFISVFKKKNLKKNDGY